jgi:hypothetical protein
MTRPPTKPSSAKSREKATSSKKTASSRSTKAPAASKAPSGNARSSSSTTTAVGLKRHRNKEDLLPSQPFGLRDATMIAIARRAGVMIATKKTKDCVRFLMAEYANYIIKHTVSWSQFDSRCMLPRKSVVQAIKDSGRNVC